MIPVEVIDRINAAVGKSRTLGTEIEGLLSNGETRDSETIQAKLAEREGYLTEADALKRQASATEQERQLDEWRNTPLTPMPLSPLQVEQRQADPSATLDYLKTFDTVIRRGHRGQMSEAERETLTIVSDGAGGYTVPADYRSQLLARLPAFSPMLSLVNAFPTSRDKVRYPRLRRHATKGSIYTSMFVGSWTGEVPGASAGQNEPTFGQYGIEIAKYRALARLSTDLVDDGEFDLLAVLAADGSRNSAIAREYAILAGTGEDNEPLGITNMAYVTSAPTEEQFVAVDVSGTTADQISNTAAAQGSAPLLIDLHYSLPAQYRNLPSCRYVMASDSIARVRKLIDANGQFLWVPGFAAEPDSLLGKPVVVSEWMPVGGTDGNVVIVFGPLEMLDVPVRKDITVSVAPERYIDTDEIGLFIHQRLGVGVGNRDAFRFGKV